jgi:selenocysteine lyase/cysteine desulfurase
LAQLGLPVYGQSGRGALGSIVCVGRLGAGHDTTGDSRMAALYEHLAAHHVRLSIRRGVLRFSLHLYNAPDDIDRVVDLVREFTLL